MPEAWPATCAWSKRRNKYHQGRHRTLPSRARLCSRDLLQKILDDTEEHIDFLETQLDLIDKVGTQNYLQSLMGEIRIISASRAEQHKSGLRAAFAEPVVRSASKSG